MKFRQLYFEHGTPLKAVEAMPKYKTLPLEDRIKVSRKLYNTNKVAIMRVKRERLRALEVTAEKIISELASVAFLDVKELYNPDGSFKPLDSIPEDARRAITGIEETENGVKVKTADKLRALELLGRNKKMFTEKIEVEASESFADLIIQARNRKNVTVSILDL